MRPCSASTKFSILIASPDALQSGLLTASFDRLEVKKYSAKKIYFRDFAVKLLQRNVT